jgi:benzoylformate decarboxylase
VFGAAVFTYHAQSDGPVIPPGVRLFQLTADPDAAAAAPVGEAIVCNVAAAVARLLARSTCSPAPWPQRPTPPPSAASGSPISPGYLMARIAQRRPRGSIVVEEAPSSRNAMNAHLPIDEAGGFFTTGSGGLGYGLPAAVGVALARPDRRVIAIVGDGSSLYAIQALWTAAQLVGNLSIVLINNGGYFALKHMASAYGLGQAVGVDIGGIDYVGLARSFGCAAERVDDPAALDDALAQLFASPRPTLLEVAVAATL